MTSRRHDLARKRRILGRRLRGAVLAFRIRSAGGSVGRGLSVERGVSLRQAPSQNWRFGDDVSIGVGAVLDIWPAAHLTIGNGVKILHYCVVGVVQELQIGDSVQVAEHCTIRDANHDVRRDVDMSTAPLVPGAVHIAAGAWIARGCAVLAGARVGEGAVIGANSVVLGDIPAFSISVGAPAKATAARKSGSPSTE